MCPSEEYLGEPMYASKKNTPADSKEDDGYIFSFLSNYNKMTTEFVIFDAQDITKGPIYRSLLPVAIPHGLHGSYADGLVFDHEEIVQKWRANNALDRTQWNEVNSGFSGLGISYDF